MPEAERKGTDPFLDPIALEVLDNVPDFVMLSGPSGDVQFFNRAWYEFTGQPPIEAGDQTWQEYVLPEDLGAVARSWRQAVAEGKSPLLLRYRLRHKSGEYRWVEATARRITDTRGAVVHWLGIAREEAVAAPAPPQPTAPRERNRVELREKIRRAALPLFLERGFEPVSVREIADAAAVAPATLFRYFRTKTEIVLDALRADLDQTIAAALASSPEVPALRAIRAALLARSDRDAFELGVVRLIDQTPALWTEAANVRDRAVRTLTASFAARTGENGAERHAAAAACAALWPHYSARTRWLSEGGARPLSAVLTEAYRIVDEAFAIAPATWIPAFFNAPATGDGPAAAARGLRERKALQLHETLLQTALHLFAVRGFDATTVDDVVREAGVSRRTFFRYFASKEDALLQRPLQAAAALGARIAAHPPEEPLLRAVAAALIVFYRELYGPPLGDVVAFLRRKPELRAARARSRVTGLRQLALGIAKRMGVADDALAPNVIATVVIWTSAHAVDHWAPGTGLDGLATSFEHSFVALHDVVTEAAGER